MCHLFFKRKRCGISMSPEARTQHFSACSRAAFSAGVCGCSNSNPTGCTTWIVPASCMGCHSCRRRWWPGGSWLQSANPRAQWDTRGCGRRGISERRLVMDWASPRKLIHRPPPQNVDCCRIQRGLEIPSPCESINKPFEFNLK